MSLNDSSCPPGHNTPLPLERSPPGSFKRLLGDTRSRTPPPTTCHPHTKKQTDTGQSTDQNGRYRGVEIRHGDRGGDRESGNPANERATAIFGQKPLQLGECENCGRHAKDTADHGAAEEPGLPCCAAKDGTDHGTEACQRPSSDEHGNGLQTGFPLLPQVVCSPNGSRLSCGA